VNDLVQVICQKALEGKQILIDAPDSLNGFMFYIFKAGRQGQYVSSKLIQQLGGKVKPSVSRQVNFLIVSDHVFELSGMDLVNNEIDYPEFQG